MTKNEFIKQIRQKYKMSQKKFADYLEVSKSLVEKIEMGKSPATPENKYVKAICKLENIECEIFDKDAIDDEFAKQILQKSVNLEKIEFLKNKSKKFKLTKKILEKIDINKLNELDIKIIEKLKYLPDSFKEYVIFVAKQNEVFEEMAKKGE